MVAADFRGRKIGGAKFRLSALEPAVSLPHPEACADWGAAGVPHDVRGVTTVDERERSGSRRLPARDGSDAGRARTSVVALVALVAGTLAAVAAGVPDPASAQVVTDDSRLFGSPGYYEYEVPAGTTTIAVTVAGASGGGWSGGNGGRVDAVVPVPDDAGGSTLSVSVGGSPVDGSRGFGGAGYPSGGGASSIVLAEEPLVVAGGGGGQGENSLTLLEGACDTPAGRMRGVRGAGGGDGGGVNTPDGSDGCGHYFFGGEGHGATTTSPGEGDDAGSDGGYFGWNCGEWRDPWTGSFQWGCGYFAWGGSGSSDWDASGGGGGGGYFGGGGGFYGGGGGSSYAIPEASQVQYSLNTGYHGYDYYWTPPHRGVFDGFVIVTPLPETPSSSTPPPDGEPSDDCKANGGERIVDGTTGGVTTMLYVDQPASDEVEVCVRVEDSSGDGYGGKLAVTPGELDPGVGGGVPSTDGDSGACSSTTPNLVPGAHPVAHGGVSSVDYMIDVYANASEAWLCLEVDPPGTNVRVKVPVGVPGVTLGGDPVTWYPDDGTPG